MNTRKKIGSGHNHNVCGKDIGDFVIKTPKNVFSNNGDFYKAGLEDMILAYNFFKDNYPSLIPRTRFFKSKKYAYIIGQKKVDGEPLNYQNIKKVKYKDFSLLVEALKNFRKIFPGKELDFFGKGGMDSYNLGGVPELENILLLPDGSLQFIDFEIFTDDKAVINNYNLKKLDKIYKKYIFLKKISKIYSDIIKDIEIFFKL